MLRPSLTLLILAAVFTGCDSTPTKPAPAVQAVRNPPEAAIPEEAQDAAKALLGGDTQLLQYGDLARTGKMQFLAANVVPNTPKSVVAGTVVTRAIIAENDDGKWMELLRCDEHLKNAKGFLGLTPLQTVNGWRLQFEESPAKGMTFYFTPIEGQTNERTLPIAVKWNPKVNRYQSMDLSYQHFLGEVATLDNPRSRLR
jgi:hypothetical protein